MRTCICDVDISFDINRDPIWSVEQCLIWRTISVENKGLRMKGRGFVEQLTLILSVQLFRLLFPLFHLENRNQIDSNDITFTWWNTIDWNGSNCLVCIITTEKSCWIQEWNVTRRTESSFRSYSVMRSTASFCCSCCQSSMKWKSKLNQTMPSDPAMIVLTLFESILEMTAPPFSET